MAVKDFDPKKFIDREFEMELFENLLQLKDQARILAIQDKGGMGKSQLLAKLVYRCRTGRPRMPVSLIDLDQLENPSPLGLIRQVVVDLEGWALNFPSFRSYYQALLAEDFAVFRSPIDLQSVNLGVSTDEVGVFSIRVSTLTPNQQKFAEEVCIEAFFNDLKINAVGTPIVLMLDAYERCEERLSAWIEGYLLDRYFFNLDKRPEQLLLVVAGREIPVFEKRWVPEDINVIVSSVQELGKWKREHVEQCLKVHGLTYTAQDVDTFFGLVELGMPPSEIVNMMHTLLHK